MFKLICCFFLSAQVSHAQTADFLIFKKKEKAIQTYYAGSQIQFTTTSGAYRDALINRIANDSLYLQEFVIRHYRTQMGFYVKDTAGSYRYAYRYTDISAIGKTRKGFNVQGSGAALFGGGVVLTLASGVVYLADRNKFSPALLIAAVALGTAGYFLGKSGSRGMIIGKRNYRMQYISVGSK